MLQRRRYEIRGQVQGVGFRPFVCRRAGELGVRGWIKNDTRGVLLETEAPDEVTDRLLEDIRTEAPVLTNIDSITLVSTTTVRAYAHAGFRIGASENSGRRDALVTPDATVCAQCLEELFDRSNRRYRYPFINCTNCGPRFSIILGLPYDRANTTMNRFVMCDLCSSEYEDANDRRFHAQPNACWQCGPRLSLRTKNGDVLMTEDPIEHTATLLDEGAIVAVKGIGGYHILGDPTNSEAVATLRLRKRRPHRPLALMCESLESVARVAHFGDSEAELLSSPARPIVLLRKRDDSPLVPGIAPWQETYGIMLAYTPLHHLLLLGREMPWIATSANVANEPIAFRDQDAIVQLSAVVDYFLSHDRDIHVRVDDSIVQPVALGRSMRAMTIRRGRGLVPTPYGAPEILVPTLALGAELKSTVSVSKERKIFTSQHIGDLKNYKNYEYFVDMAEGMLRMLEVEPAIVACDLHPEMASTRYAYESQLAPVVQVQHHHAHMAACLFENDTRGPAIGVTFDGFGYGDDGTLWGGEFLVGDYCRVERRAHFRHIPLVGGDAAVREPYRVALALLAHAFGHDEAHPLARKVLEGPSLDETALVLRLLERQVYSPITSSVGRLFDGVSSLLGVRHKATYEGQAAMELEQLASTHEPSPSKPLSYSIEQNDDVLQVDWRPLIAELVSLCLNADTSPGVLSSRFHCSLASIVRDVCIRLRDESNINIVALTGGVFLNRYLLSVCHDLLCEDGFRVCSHGDVLTNDGGISVGQAVVADARHKAGLTV